MSCLFTIILVLIYKITSTNYYYIVQKRKNLHIELNTRMMIWRVERSVDLNIEECNINSLIL